jgi:NAD+ kinase
MTIGIIPNISKENMLDVVKKIISELIVNKFEYVLSDTLLSYRNQFDDNLQKSIFMSHPQLGECCDIIVSIGGDGTMLKTAFDVRNTSTPILGLNFGKLGFLAEFDLNSFIDFLQDIKVKNYYFEERMTLVASCGLNAENELYAVNDLVIDKGPWSKMIQLTMKIDNDYVSTFSADGLIIATPTGTTGYSLSVGGPIVNPQADVITLCPIAPHTLTIRPLVISSKQKISIIVNSPVDSVQIRCDGQRVSFVKPFVTIEIEKSKHPFRLVHSSRTNYFEILRNKLYWGLDIRKTNE